MNFFLMKMTRLLQMKFRYLKVYKLKISAVVGKSYEINALL